MEVEVLGSCGMSHPAVGAFVPDEAVAPAEAVSLGVALLLGAFMQGRAPGVVNKGTGCIPKFPLGGIVLYVGVNGEGGNPI